jgi:hypothetical protein
MFTAFGMFFSMVGNIFKIGDTVARTGVKYAEHFEYDADIILVGKRAALDATIKLHEV